MICLGLVVEVGEPWTGRLEIEMSVNGKRVFERKHVSSAKQPRSDMAQFRIGAISARDPETTT